MTTARQSENRSDTTIANGEAKPLSLAMKTNPAVAPAAGPIRAADCTTAPPRPVEPPRSAEMRSTSGIPTLVASIEDLTSIGCSLLFDHAWVDHALCAQSGISRS